MTILPVYDTVADKEGIAELKKQLTRGRISLVTFTSASTIEKFAVAVKAVDLPKLFADVKIASIGPITTQALEKAGLKAAMEAQTSTSEGLADTIINCFRK